MKARTATALALFVSLGLALPAAAQQQQGPAARQPGTTGVTNPEAAAAEEIAADADQYVTAEEAAAYDEQRFGAITGGQEYMTREQFDAELTGLGSKAVAATFEQVDEDGDGQISRAEWLLWRQQRFTEATAGTEGRMGAEEYQTWERGGEATQQ